MNHGEAVYLALPAAPHAAYAPASSSSRAAMAALILAIHVVLLFALASLGRAVLEIVHPPMVVNLLPEPAPMRTAPPPAHVPLPQLRKPELVIPDTPRFETLAAVQVVETPAPPPAPVKVPVAAAPSPVPNAEPTHEPPRFDLAYLNNPAPSYPIFAKRAREQGKVILRVQVDAGGQVAGIEVHQSSGSERLDKAALAAVKQWRFAPARSGDRAVAGVALVPISFQLEG